MAAPNVRAIGAVVYIVANGVTQIRLITAGTSYLGQEPAEACFGIGAATLVESVTVDWPDGMQDVLTNVNANQVLTVQQASRPPIPSGLRLGRAHRPSIASPGWDGHNPRSSAA